MKRLLAALAVTVSLSALAKDVPAVIVRVTDTAGLVAAVSKVGEFIGNPMLAMPLTANITANPAVKFFGPGRAGVPVTGVVTVDPEKAVSVETLEGNLHFAVLYPVTKGKAAFLKDHPDATEKDGVISMKDPKDAFVAFSADEKWAVLTDKAEGAQVALKRADRAQAPLGGDVMQARFTAEGISMFGRLFEDALVEKLAEAKLGKGSQQAVADVAKLFKQLSSSKVALRVDDAGVSILSQVKPAADSAYAKFAPEALPSGDALAFAGKDAFFASAYAKDCGQGDFDAGWAKFTAFVAKQGLDLAWLACAKQGAARTLTLDVDAAVKYFAGAGKAKIDALDPEKFMQELAALDDDKSLLSFEGPAGALALAVKGLDTAFTPSARFARIAPEAAAKKPAYVSVVSPYAAVRAFAPKALALLPEEVRAAVGPLVQTLPPDNAGGFVSYTWRENDVLKSVARVSPDEIKGLSSCFALGVSLVMQQQMQAMQMDTSDDADDED